MKKYIVPTTSVTLLRAEGLMATSLKLGGNTSGSEDEETVDEVTNILSGERSSGSPIWGDGE